MILNKRYKILEVMGRGGFGITYKAVDLLLNSYVAIKESNGVAPDLFHAETLILQATRDIPHTGRLLDNFYIDSKEYVVRTLIFGETMAEYQERKGGKLPAAQVMDLMHDFLNTLKELHAHGIIHRDISPWNLILSEDGELYLIDFGSAAFYQKPDKSLPVFEHRGLHAPEYADITRQGPWTDIFSLCATIVYLITGEGIADAALRGNLDFVPRLLMGTGLTSNVQNALLKGLNPEISLRFQTIEELSHKMFLEDISDNALPHVRHARYDAGTMTGQRKNNQDNFAIDTEFHYLGEDIEGSGEIKSQKGELHVAVVCDGVGGSCHGELASKASVQAVIHFFEAFGRTQALPERLMEDLLDQINEKILTLGEKIGSTATTIALFFWTNDRFYIANIGDSPIYLLRGRSFKRLTTPHTRAALQLMTGKPVSGDDYNILMKYLGKAGVSGSQMASYRSGRIADGDIFLICSDGIVKELKENQIIKYLKSKTPIENMFKALGKKKGSDNCTGIILKF